MKIVVDMNLTPQWCKVLNAAGHQAVHWSEVGDPHAPDHQILTWARDNDFVVFSHDLDFSAILAANQANAPSVLQIRGQDVMPASSQHLVLAALDQHQQLLMRGALLVIQTRRARVRILPLRQNTSAADD